MTSHLELKHEVIAVCRRLEAQAFTIGTYGNVSVRVPEGLIVTPSRVDYSTLVPDDMVTVALDGTEVDGAREPSSETDVHRLIYVHRADVGAVIHCHSLYATAASCLHRSIPVIVEEQSQVIGDAIRCTEYMPAGQHLPLGEEVARVLGDSNAALLANHGTVSCGRTLAEALFTTQITERIAQMWLLTSAIGTPITIPDEFVRSERDRWLYKYGTVADRRH
jgi:L-fuculose-phosphate aldolase